MYLPCPYPSNTRSSLQFVFGSFSITSMPGQVNLVFNNCTVNFNVNYVHKWRKLFQLSDSSNSLVFWLAAVKYLTFTRYNFLCWNVKIAVMFQSCYYNLNLISKSLYIMFFNTAFIAVVIYYIYRISLTNVNKFSLKSESDKDGPLFFPRGGGVSWFLGARKFFPPSIERFQVFFLHSGCADNFFLNSPNLA